MFYVLLLFVNVGLDLQIASVFYSINNSDKKQSYNGSQQ